MERLNNWPKAKQLMSKKVRTFAQDSGSKVHTYNHPMMTGNDLKDTQKAVGTRNTKLDHQQHPGQSKKASQKRRSWNCFSQFHDLVCLVHSFPQKNGMKEKKNENQLWKKMCNIALVPRDPFGSINFLSTPRTGLVIQTYGPINSTR